MHRLVRSYTQHLVSYCRNWEENGGNFDKLDIPLHLKFEITTLPAHEIIQVFKDIKSLMDTVGRLGDTEKGEWDKPSQARYFANCLEALYLNETAKEN